MISRRNIRVKVMQLLYMIEVADSPITYKNPIQLLEKQLDKSRELFIYLIYFLSEVARYAETSAQKRANKNLPSSADLNVNIKIAGNDFIWQLLENKSYQKALETDHPEKVVDMDLVKNIYTQLSETSEYKIYITEQSRDKAKEREIIKLIFTELILPNEDFIAHIESHFNNWDDDADMMDQLVLAYIQKPNSIQLDQLMNADKWDFARVLLKTTIEKQEYCAELITPKLKNWDADRIAQLDMVLMRMGICELLYFDTIPTKVSINEYIDLAKEYSTEQSGQFVNGILDNIHKELLTDGKINKISFKNKAV
ncbi:MAG: transcription antitermination factor NusB [Sphingobacteriia bacterium]|nr:MAG: transcription antitermination factor NusB [Sphingobacteriia bacterium]